MAAHKSLSASLFVLVGALFLAGCLPIPVVPHGLGVVPDKDAFESLCSGATTRADVLLSMGEPKYRLDDDRFLMWEWDVAYGWVAIGGGYSGVIFPVMAPHYFCLEFGPDSQLARCDHLVGSLYAKPDKAMRRCMKRPEKPDEPDETK
jgi:hypothetical protein